MVVVLMMEWELPKEEHRMRKLLEVSQKWHDYFIKLSKEKMIKTNYVRVCTDDTGYFVEWWELESLAEFQKVWDDEGSQRLWAEFAMVVDGCRNRILRPYIKGLEFRLDEG